MALISRRLLSATSNILQCSVSSCSARPWQQKCASPLLVRADVSRHFLFVMYLSGNELNDATFRKIGEINTH